jgi:hypothetical protein
MLFAVRIAGTIPAHKGPRSSRHVRGTEAAIDTAVREIAATKVDDDGLGSDVSTIKVGSIREDNRYGGLRAVVQVRLAQARIHVQIDVSFGDALMPAATDLEFPTLLGDMPSPIVLA